MRTDDDVAGRQMTRIAQVDLAVDFRSVGLGAAGRANAVMMLRMGSVEVTPVRALFRRRNFVHPVDQHVERLADLGGELLGGDARGKLHDALVPLLLHLFRHMVGEGVRGGALTPART